MPRRPVSAPRHVPRRQRRRARGVRAGYAAAALIRGVPLWADLLYAGASAAVLRAVPVDKGAARAGRERISESMLLSLGFVGGWPGAIVAQQALRNKTVKRAFRIRFWLSVAANVAIFAWAAKH